MKQYHIFHSTGINKFEEVEHQPRVYVGFVNASSLEKAFEYAQNDHVDWAMNEVRSCNNLLFIQYTTTTPPKHITLK